MRTHLPDPVGWAARGRLTYRSPTDWVALGVLAEESGHLADRLYIWVACVPLFAPIEHLVLDHSGRVPNGSSPVGFDDEATFEAMLHLAIEQVPSQGDALRRIASSDKEESAYALLLLGEFDAAAERLAEPYFPHDDRPFVTQARRRRDTIDRTLHDDGAEEATAVLRSWRDDSVRALDIH